MLLADADVYRVYHLCCSPRRKIRQFVRSFPPWQVLLFPFSSLFLCLCNFSSSSVETKTLGHDSIFIFAHILFSSTSALASRLLVLSFSSFAHLVPVKLVHNAHTEWYMSVFESLVSISMPILVLVATIFV